MAALAAERITPSRKGLDFSDPVAAAAKCWAGGIVVLNASGFAQPGTTATGLVARGVCQTTADNTGGADGDITVASRAGIYRLANAGDVVRTNIDGNAYIVDDQTVSASSGGGTRSIAGVIKDVDATGVWVDVGKGALAGAADLAASNNLSDVVSASSARANIGANKHYVSIEVADVHGSATYHGIAPVAGTITKMWSVINGALTTADATLTGKIAGTPITGGAIDVVQAGSAAGQVNTATPSAANTVAAGQDISITVSGTEASDVAAKVIFEITY